MENSLDISFLDAHRTFGSTAVKWQEGKSELYSRAAAWALLAWQEAWAASTLDPTAEQPHALRWLGGKNVKCTPRRRADQITLIISASGQPPATWIMLWFITNVGHPHQYEPCRQLLCPDKQEVKHGRVQTNMPLVSSCICSSGVFLPLIPSYGVYIQVELLIVVVYGVSTFLQALLPSTARREWSSWPA